MSPWTDIIESRAPGSSNMRSNKLNAIKIRTFQDTDAVVVNLKLFF